MTALAVARAVTMAETFGQVLRRLRDAADLSQMDLAVRAGLNLFTVAKLEQGKREPTWDTVQALAAALGVSCEEFVTRPSPPPPADPGEPRKGRKGKGGGK
jgi:transcriptional regulator with XRE-family HTH domain